MIAFVMLSNKSQYILSKIGIPLYEDAKNPTKNDEMNIYFFQKDNILTLHANSVDDYSEKEMKLLEAIIDSIHGPNTSPTMGSLFASNTQPLEIHHFSEGEKLKAIIIFSSSIEPYIKINAISSPSLEEMFSDKSLKKTLWEKLKSFHTT